MSKAALLSEAPTAQPEGGAVRPGYERPGAASRPLPAQVEAEAQIADVGQMPGGKGPLGYGKALKTLEDPRRPRPPHGRVDVPGLVTLDVPPADIKYNPSQGKRVVSTLSLAQIMDHLTQRKLGRSAADLGLSPHDRRQLEIAHIMADGLDAVSYQLTKGDASGVEWYNKDMDAFERGLVHLVDTAPAYRRIRGYFGSPSEQGHVLPDPKDPMGNPRLVLFKAVMTPLSFGSNPQVNVTQADKVFQAAVKAQPKAPFTALPPYNPNPAEGRGPLWSVAGHNVATMFEALNRLVKEKGEDGAAQWLLSDHPLAELQRYHPRMGVRSQYRQGEAIPGAFIFGPKGGAFFLNINRNTSHVTKDRWFSRSVNRALGTLINPSGRIQDVPRPGDEREMMDEAVARASSALGQLPNEFQAAYWYYEQALWTALGADSGSLSFADGVRETSQRHRTGPVPGVEGRGGPDESRRKAAVAAAVARRLSRRGPKPGGGCGGRPVRYAEGSLVDFTPVTDQGQRRINEQSYRSLPEHRGWGPALRAINPHFKETDPSFKTTNPAGLGQRGLIDELGRVFPPHHPAHEVAKRIRQGDWRALPIIHDYLADIDSAPLDVDGKPQLISIHDAILKHAKQHLPDPKTFGWQDEPRPLLVKPKRARKPRKPKPPAEPTPMARATKPVRYAEGDEAPPKRVTKPRVSDLTGMVFGRLTALEPTDKVYHGNRVWRVRCECGRVGEVPRHTLMGGRTTSCGCTPHGPAATTRIGSWEGESAKPVGVKAFTPGPKRTGQGQQSKEHTERYRPPAPPEAPETLSRRGAPARYASTITTSNNVEEGPGMDFATAFKRMKSPNHASYKAVTRKVLADLGLHTVTTHDAIGDWVDGAENSLVHAIHDPVDYDTAQYAAAWMGHLADQKAVLHFSEADDGPDSLYEVHTQVTDPAKVRASLDAAGIPFRTIIPRANGTTVQVYDQGRQWLQRIATFAGSHHAVISESSGRGEFVGDTAGKPTRSAARAKYRAIIDAYEAKRGSGQAPAGSAAAARAGQPQPLPAGAGSQPDLPDAGAARQPPGAGQPQPLRASRASASRRCLTPDKPARYAADMDDNIKALWRGIEANPQDTDQRGVLADAWMARAKRQAQEAKPMTRDETPERHGLGSFLGGLDKRQDALGGKISQRVEAQPGQARKAVADLPGAAKAIGAQAAQAVDRVVRPGPRQGRDYKVLPPVKTVPSARGVRVGDRQAPADEVLPAEGPPAGIPRFNQPAVGVYTANTTPEPVDEAAETEAAGKRVRDMMVADRTVGGKPPTPSAARADTRVLANPQRLGFGTGAPTTPGQTAPIPGMPNLQAPKVLPKPIAKKPAVPIQKPRKPGVA